MVYPIYGYGHSVLKREAEEIEEDFEGLEQLIEDMFETMYASNGVGLAAPQIGKSIRIFVIDSKQLEDDEEEIAEKKSKGEKPFLNGVKKAFINPIILEEEGKPWDYEEGCLSIPDITADVSRKPKIVIEYQNEKFEIIEETFDGLNARVIQHEYDHLEGILFTDHLKPLKRRLMKRKLDAIKKGKVEVEYRMKFAEMKKKR
jgi:peptide deformylase